MTDFEDRKSYAKGSLQDLEHADIMGFLKGWLEEAKSADPDDYNAMTLSTVGRDGHPNARIVLLRSLEQTETGWAVAFYTNYQSEKGLELSEHPFAAATFFWSALERQLRRQRRVSRQRRAPLNQRWRLPRHQPLHQPLQQPLQPDLAMVWLPTVSAYGSVEGGGGGVSRLLRERQASVASGC